MFEMIVNDPFARGIIRRKVRQLVECSGFPRQDWEDLEQELICMLLGSLQSFDDTLPQHRNVLITTVVERSISLIRRRRNRRRKYLGEVQSLDVSRSEDSEGAENNWETVDEDSHRAFAQVDLRVDLQSLLADLPAEFRDLACRLARQRLSEIARELNVAEGTIRFRRDQIRTVLSEARSRYFS